MNRRREQYYQHAHDERVEPHHDLVPGAGMPDPDWGGVQIHPNQKKMPVGDPTLWANTITTLIDADPVLGATPRVIVGDQIILAQAADRYSRSWSLIGAVTIPSGADMVDPSPTPPSTPYDYASQLVPLSVWLSITVGIEKITTEQQVLLLSGLAAGGGGNYGLCNTQSSVNGGPYGITYNIIPPNPFDVNFTGTLPFAMIGALVGNTISVKAIYARSPVASGPSGTPVSRAIVSCLITPYAPGAGI